MKHKQLLFLTVTVFTTILFFNCLGNKQCKPSNIFVWMGEGKNHSDKYLKMQFERLNRLTFLIR